jgi:hypothetical protein
MVFKTGISTNVHATGDSLRVLRHGTSAQLQAPQYAHAASFGNHAAQISSLAVLVDLNFSSTSLHTALNVVLPSLLTSLKISKTKSVWFNLQLQGKIYFNQRPSNGRCLLRLHIILDKWRSLLC